MADLVTRLKLDNSQYNSNIDSAKEKTREFQDQAEDASKSVNELGNKGAKSASDLLKEMGKIEGAGRSASNYKRQLAELQKTITDLTVAYRGMSDEMKNSPLGQEVAGKIQELTQQAAVYKDAIMDVQQEIKKMASDTAVWDGMKQGIDTVSSALQGFVAAGVLGEKSTEKLVAVLAKLKAMEAATNAVIKIGNALQKNSALIASISTIQTKALAKAKLLEASATGKATIAQKLFNAVAKANPYVLLATAILAVGTALVAFASKSKEAEEAEKRRQEQIEKEKEELDSWAQKVGSSTGSILSKYKLLQIEWKKLSTEHQKKQWIVNNKSEFENLGLKVNDVISAENTFVNNTSAVVEALKKRAMAAAKQAQLTELYTKLMEEQVKAEARYERERKEVGQDYHEEISPRTQGNFGSRKIGQSHINSRTGQRENGAYYYTEKGAENANKKIKKEAFATVDAIQEKIDALAADIASGLDVSSLFKQGTTPTIKPEIKPEEGSLAAWQKTVADLQTKLNNMNPNNAEFGKTKKELEDAKKEVEKIQELLKQTQAPEIFPRNSLAEANHFVQLFQKQLQELDPNTDEFKEILDLLNLWKKKQEEINKAIQGTQEEVKTLSDIYKDISSQRDAIQFKYDIGEIDESEAVKQINELNKKLSSLGLKANLKLEIDTSEAVKQMEAFVSSMDKVASVGQAVSAINSVYDSISNLGDKLEEAENGWEAFFAIFQTGMTIFNAVATIIETVATVTDLLTASTAASAIATGADATATTTDATAKGVNAAAASAASAALTTSAASATADAAAQNADAAATITNAAAHGAVAAASAGQSVASIPYVGPILAIAAIAAVMAAIIGIIASAKGFASGGIVDAPSKIGDKNIIRVNGGEMILNTRQQENLFKMLDEGRVDRDANLGGNVEFKINGTQLVGVLNNINKKNSKL